MEILGKILGSSSRVKLMRLFLLNRTKSFKTKDIIKRSRVSADAARKELRLLLSIGFVKKKGVEYIFDYTFKYAKELDGLLVGSDVLDKDAVLENFKKAGKAKFIAVSGIFIKNKDSRVDVLIVGDKMKKARIEEGIRKLEAEIGAELVYAVFETKEFLYRISMYDKLVRDILDYPHEVLLQAKELSTSTLKKP
jgi:hypothetical protein